MDTSEDCLIVRFSRAFQAKLSDGGNRGLDEIVDHLIAYPTDGDPVGDLDILRVWEWDVTTSHGASQANVVYMYVEDVAGHEFLFFLDVVESHDSDGGDGDPMTALINLAVRLYDVVIRALGAFRWSQ